MNVYLLEEGDGSDGDESRVLAVFASREAAQAEAEERERASWRRAGNNDEYIAKSFATFHYGGDDWGRHRVYEWEVTA